MEPLVGDMVYVSSEAYVFQVGRQGRRFEKLIEPKSFLVIGKEYEHYKILMLGNPWWVRKRDVYTIQKEMNNDRKAS